MASQAEQVQALAEAQAQERLEQLHDPGTPAADVADLLWEQYEGDPLMVGVAALLAGKGSSLERLDEVADALEERELGPGVTALSFRALVAQERGDAAAARRSLDLALERAPDAEARVELAPHLHWHGRIGEALRALREHLVHAPDDDWAVERYGVALEAAHAADPADADEDEARLRQAELASFADRDGLYALRTALEEYVPRSRYAAAMAEHAEEWMDAAGLDGERTPDSLDAASASVDEEQVVRLAIEHALVAGSDSDDRQDCALADFGGDPGTPPELAAAARGWFDHARYGLWQISDVTPGPGLWCRDVLTGSLRYVQFAPEQVDRLPRWAVLLGLLVPIDGVWRSAGATLQLSPAEADAVCETIRAGAESIVHAQLGSGRSRKAQRRLRHPVPFGQADPHGVLGELDEPSAPAVVNLLSTVTGVLLPRIYAELSAYRAAPPRLHNTDGDPMRLITARLRAADLDTLTAKLAAHPDFRADDEDGEVTWLGEPIPAAQRESMLAELRAQLAAEGHDPELLVGEDQQRWVRGQLRRDRDTMTVTVNSQQRLERLLALLTDLDAQPQIVEQTQVDPAQDLAWAAGRRLSMPTLAAPEQGWEKHWLDEPVPALHGDTPRQAAAGEHRAHLETLLREFEYDNDRRPPDSGSGPDIAWLREQLDMPGPNDD